LKVTGPATLKARGMFGRMPRLILRDLEMRWIVPQRCFGRDGLGVCPFIVLGLDLSEGYIGMLMVNLFGMHQAY
jgi:hypothetical protein